jgi:hypothetical protein
MGCLNIKFPDSISMFSHNWGDEQWIQRRVKGWSLEATLTVMDGVFNTVKPDAWGAI